jgi:hypothetical protein
MPETPTCNTEFVASLDTLSVPLAYPAEEGPKFTATFTDWLGESVMFEPPLTLYPVPEMFTVAMCTYAAPLLVRLTSSDVAVPTGTFPKLKFEVLAVRTASAPGVADASELDAPVPDVPDVPADRVRAQPPVPTVATKAAISTTLRNLKAQLDFFCIKALHTFSSGIK